MKKPRGGFTIAEIMVVLGVVGLLATLVVLGARKLQQIAAIRAVTNHIQNVVAMHTTYVGVKGALTVASGFGRSPQTMTGTNFATSNPGRAASYCDVRMVYVSNSLMRVDEAMLTVPTALRGGLSGARAGAAFELVAAQATSADGLSWSRTPDIAMTAAPYLAPGALLTDGQSIFACAYDPAATLRPAPNGAARTGPALVFTLVVGGATYQLIQSELEEKLGRTKGYNVTVTALGGNAYQIDVVSPRMGI